MRLRPASVALCALLAAACTSGRDNAPGTTGTPGTTSISGAGGGGGASATGSGGDDIPVSSVGGGPTTTTDAATTGVGGAGGTGQGGGTGGDGGTSQGGGTGEGGAPDPTCADLLVNGDETDVDCGGSCPLPCADGLACLLPDDCTSGMCGDDFFCAAPTCTDDLRNGDESDVDCGGALCEKCGAGKSCGGAGDCASALCTGGTCVCPAGMTTVPVAGGGSYCMDPTEVTYAEYDLFLTSNPQTDIPGCEFNDGGYTPTSLWPPEPSDSAAPNYIRKPVRFVDWCDAASFCERAGKRLCGSVQGGPGDLASLEDESVDQWFNACSAQDANEYPYSGIFDTDRCTESVDVTNTAPSNVRQANGNLITTCLGGFSGLYQLSGNLAEWEDACDATTGATDNCALRGGSYLSTDPADLLCSAFDLSARDTKSAEIGFRCCQ